MYTTNNQSIPLLVSSREDLVSKLMGDGGRSIGPMGESGRSGEESPSSLPPVSPGGEDWLGECKPPCIEDSCALPEESPPKEW